MAKGSRLAGVADGLVPRRRAGMPDVITCTSEGDDPSGRGRQGVDRPDDAPAGPAQGCELGATTRKIHAPAVAGNPCASRMIPLESPVPEIGTPGSESGGRKRAYGLRTAARPRKRRTSHRALPVTRLPSTLHESGRYPVHRYGRLGAVLLDHVTCLQTGQCHPANDPRMETTCARSSIASVQCTAVHLDLGALVGSEASPS